MPLFPSKQQHTITTRDISAPLPIQQHASTSPHPSPASSSRIAAAAATATTIGSGSKADRDPPPQIATFIDYARYTFAPTSVPPASVQQAEKDGARGAEEDGYGCLRGVGRGVKLGLKDLGVVVADVAKELGERGLDTPLLFSNQALDLSPGKIRLFIQSYIATLTPRPTSTQSLTVYRNNLRLCQPYELAWFLRWALGRVVRLVREEHVSPGVDRSKVVNVREREVRGLVDWAEYEIWRGKERAKTFPVSFIDSFFAAFPPNLSAILQTLLTLLSRLTAHSHLSGLTPAPLSSLFGPLIFGLEDASFTATHAAYIRAAGATEHLVLAFIRAQAAAHDRLTGDFPRTLREWIQGYPTAPGRIICDRELDLGLPRKGVRAVPVYLMQRNVRSYTRGLIKSHVDWIPAYEVQTGRKWKPWGNVVGPTSVGRGDASLPVVTEAYRLRLRLKLTKSLQSTRSSPSRKAEATRESESAIDAQAVGGEDEWGLFEDSGFHPGDDFKEKLRFDLSESAKQQVTSKRMTMTWDDFTSPSGGFDRAPSALADSLAITQPLVEEHLQHWPEERDELRKQLRKGYKELPSFDAYEHRYRVLDREGEKGSALWVEEPFLDVWADLLVSGGWMETDELTYRPANWVILEYQKQSQHASVENAASVFVFEEFVPAQYQDALRHPKFKRLDIFKRFPRHSIQEDIGHKRSPSSGKEAKFDAQIRKGNDTKVATLSKPLSASVLGSPPPISPQSPQSNHQYRSFDTQVSFLDHSPSTKHTSFNIFDRLNRVSPKRSSIQGQLLGSCTNLQVMTMLEDDGDRCRYPAKSGAAESQSKDRARWIGVLAANGARAMDVQPCPPAVQHASHLATPGFRVLSRSTSMSPPGPYTLVTPCKTIARNDGRPQYQSIVPAGTFRSVSRSESPSPPLSFVISTKPSSDTLPDPGTGRHEATGLDLDLKRVARPALVTDHTHLCPGNKSIHSIAAQINNSRNARSVEVLQDESPRADLRHELMSAVNYRAPLGQAAPFHLERPLPLPPAYASVSMPRDTVFSVIDGYANDRSETASSLGRYEPGWENVATDDIFSAKPLPKIDSDADSLAVSQPRDSGCSMYSNVNLESTSESNDHEGASSIWSPAEEHGDGTASASGADGSESDLASDGFEPPPNLAAIEAIARQPSPGRYPNGVPLNFVHEESEWDSSDSEGNYRSALSAPQTSTSMRNRISEYQR